MEHHKLEAAVKCATVGDLMDAAIEGDGGQIYTGFRIVRRTLSDKSTVLDFELTEDE